MVAADDTVAVAPDGYIRGATATLNRRRTTQISVGFVVVTLLGIAAALFVHAANHNATLRRLQHHGVPVSAMVQQCVGIASGTGITATGYDCTASYSYADRHYAAIVHGLSDYTPPGTTVAVMIDPSHPASISTAVAVLRAAPSWRAYLPACWTLLSVLVVLGATAWLVRRANPRDSHSRDSNSED